MSFDPHDAALVLAAHGDQRGESPNAALLAHRDALAEILFLRRVTAGVLKSEPTLESALAAAAASGAQQVLLFPFFMADGYFVRRVLPARVQAAGMTATTRILQPLGLDARLAPLIHGQAMTAAREAGIDPAAARLLLVGHGSELGPASADATRAMARLLGKLSGIGTVATAFLEEPPFLDAALAEGPQPTIVSGFFSGDGLHAGEDVPQAIAAAGANAVYAGAIGGSPAVPGLIAAAVRDALALGPCGQN